MFRVVWSVALFSASATSTSDLRPQASPGRYVTVNDAEFGTARRRLRGAKSQVYRRSLAKSILVFILSSYCGSPG